MVMIRLGFTIHGMGVLYNMFMGYDGIPGCQFFVGKNGCVSRAVFEGRSNDTMMHHWIWGDHMYSICTVKLEFQIFCGYIR